MKLTKEKHEEVIFDVEIFNEFLEEFVEAILQRVLLEIPNIVIHQIREVNEITRLRRQFFKDNPELIGKEGVLIQAVNKVASDNPAWSREKVYNEAALKAKEILKWEKENVQGV